MAEAYMQPVEHPSAWTLDEIGSLESLTLQFDQRHIDAF